MIAALERINARRVWFVPEVEVWGLPASTTIEFLTLEQVESNKTVGYTEMGIGESAQLLSFSALIDHRGNSLPPTIQTPRVLVRSRGTESAFVVGQETDSAFKLARDPATSGPVTVDLLVIEMGS